MFRNRQFGDGEVNRHVNGIAFRNEATNGLQIKLQKKEKEVLQSILLTLSMKLKTVIMLTLTVQDMQTMLKT